MQDRLKDHFKKVIDVNISDRIRLEEILRADREAGRYQDKIECSMGRGFFDKYYSALAKYEFEEEYSAFLEGVRLGVRVAETAFR